MEQIKILISHAHDEKPLAEAWRNLLAKVSLNFLQVWFSSDIDPTGGMNIGGEWRKQLYQKLKESHFVIVIQTPSSSGRPWIMWECAVASGLDGERGLIPIAFSMGRGDLSNPLTTYQVYLGSDKNQVQEICNRLISKAGLQLDQDLFDKAHDVYCAAIDLHKPRPAIKIEQMLLWKTRFEELARYGRFGEVLAKRDAMYASLGRPFNPQEPTLHELLSKILLDQRHYKEAIEEIDYAISLVGEDVDLLHRKALVLVQMHSLPEAERIISTIISRHPNLTYNAELASLEGRIYRERWASTGQYEHLDKAFQAYYRAYNADQTQYYPCINAASLSLAKGSVEQANELFTKVLMICEELQQQSVVSYWVDFTVGEALLGLGQEQDALLTYHKACSRVPPPSLRDRESAFNGARRMIEAKKLTGDIIEALNRILLKK